MTLPLPCGHDPLPQEALRAGSDHWCPVEQRWYGPGYPVAEARHLAEGHAVSRPPDNDRDALILHSLLHEAAAPADHQHACPRCGTDHSDKAPDTLGEVLACTRAQAARAGGVAVVDQIDALARDLGLARDRALAAYGLIPQTLGEDGGLVRCVGCGGWLAGAEVCERCQADGL